MDGDRRLRVGLIGCGRFMNGSLIPSIRLAPMQVVAVCDRNLPKAEATGRSVGAERIYTVPSELVERERLDLVIMTVGPAAYPALAEQALRAGMHVYVEKPPALTPDDARRMAEVARECGRQLAVGFAKRFATACRMAKEITLSEEFGPVAHVSTRFSSGLFTPVWTKVHSPLAFVLDHSIHHLDLLRFYGGPVASVCAEAMPERDGRFGFAAVLRFASGATGLIEVSNYESRGVPNEALRIVGEGRSVAVDNLSTLTYFRGAEPMDRNRAFDPGRETLTWAPNTTAVSPENSSLAHQGFLGEMRNLAETLLRGEPVQPDIGEGIAALELAHAILESRGEVVRLDTA